MSFAKRWLRKTANVAGDTAAYGLAVPTAGLSLLGKQGVRESIGDAWGEVNGDIARRKAATALTGATDRATAVQKEALDSNLKLNQPWIDAGTKALSDLSGGMASGAFNAPVEAFNEQQPGPFQDSGQAPEQYHDAGFNFQEDPGYQFRLQQAQKAIERSAAAKGGLFSGATLSDLAGKSGQMASEEYGQAYDRYANNRNFQSGQAADNINQFNNNRNFKYGQYTDTLNQFNNNRNNFNNTQAVKRQGLNDRFDRLSTLAGLGTTASARSGASNTLFGQQAGDNAVTQGQITATNDIAGHNSNVQLGMGILNAGTQLAGTMAGGKK